MLTLKHDRFDQYGNFRFWDVATHDLPAISADGKTLVAFSDEMGMGGCRRVVLAFLAVPTGKVTELTHLLPDCMEYPTQPPRSTSPMFATSLRFAPQTPDSPRLRGAASTVAPRGQR